MQKLSRRAILAAALVFSAFSMVGAPRAAEMTPLDVAKAYVAAWNEKNAKRPPLTSPIMLNISM